ncbi:hypothetical protein E0H39_11760 [Rhizobium leguminosarum bv. viciae]|nr:hypothetical protein [Rhizobium leguminosarum bv. viciae]RWX25045.1 hypothetical protein EHH54_36380 [Rhizobium leguminosarum]NKK14592.1 hypothetical protein [Rhizobium leguminosarum bv. viciae]NKK28808.1 hypothetical protein [Rhizobium leguminosarum bv. viciae]NKK34856.1 hypothetical protein [Rhizobium leguminosarum bv. viciae]
MLLTVCREAPSSGCRHLLPAGEKKLVATSRFPLLPRGEGARRADEGAARHTANVAPKPTASVRPDRRRRLAGRWPGRSSCRQGLPSGRGRPCRRPR